MLAQTTIEYVPFIQLVRSDLNARKKAPSVTGIIELACSVAAVGLLQNLIVYPISENEFGVVGGGRRLLALALLNNPDSVDELYASSFKSQLEELGLSNNKKIIQDDYPVAVKKVTKDMALMMSLTENGKREAMHPSDQINGFLKLSVSGHAPSKIAELMGYSTKHVQKCLRLASMAPTLLLELAEDKISLDQLQALSTTEDHERQVNVWSNAYGYYKNPEELRRTLLRGEVNANESSELKFVGRQEYENAGGTFRYDLFTDEGFICDMDLLVRLVREKLDNKAKEIASIEGWLWSEGRVTAVRSYGDDAQMYSISRDPELIYTEAQQNRITYLETTVYALNEQLEENDDDASNDESICDAISEFEDEIDQINKTALLSSWSQEVKNELGVIVSLDQGDFYIQRGIKLKVEEISQDEDAETNVDSNSSQLSQSQVEKESGISLSEKLIKSLSSERTMAVQAALAQRSDVALPLLAFALITETFGSYNRSCLDIRISQKQSTLKSNAPTIEGSRAEKELGELRNSWEARFPENWEANFEWLLTWSQDDLVGLISYCIAGGLSGINYTLSKGKAGNELVPVEKALSFNLRDYWQPTAENYFSRIKKDNIAVNLVDAGLDVQAMQISGMKKGEAAERAEQQIAKTRWIPACLQHPSDSVAEANNLPNDTLETIADTNTEDDEEQAA